MKVLIWKSLIGALPTREKAEYRGIGSAVCKGCIANIEIVHHLFHNCPCISFVGKAICRWIFRIWGVRLSKMQLLSARWTKQSQGMDTVLAGICFSYLKSIWLARNN